MDKWPKIIFDGTQKSCIWWCFQFVVFLCKRSRITLHISRFALCITQCTLKPRSENPNVGFESYSQLNILKVVRHAHTFMHDNTFTVFTKHHIPKISTPVWFRIFSELYFSSFSSVIFPLKWRFELHCLRLQKEDKENKDPEHFEQANPKRFCCDEGFNMINMKLWLHLLRFKKTSSFKIQHWIWLARMNRQWRIFFLTALLLAINYEEAGLMFPWA